MQGTFNIFMPSFVIKARTMLLFFLKDNEQVLSMTPASNWIAAMQGMQKYSAFCPQVGGGGGPPLSFFLTVLFK